MNFTTIHQEDRLVYAYQMREKETGELYGNLLSIYMCELPRINKHKLSEMSPLEQSLYIIRNIHIFASVPDDLDPRYTQWFKDARTEQLQLKEKQQYFRAMISDYEKNDIATAYLARGREEGRVEGVELVAKNILSLGIMSIEDIAKSTGLSPERIKSL